MTVRMKNGERGNTERVIEKMGYCLLPTKLKIRELDLNETKNIKLVPMQLNPQRIVIPRSCLFCILHLNMKK